MKKKLSMIVFVAVLIAFTCMYAIVDKNNAIYDRAVDTSQYVALGLEQGEMVSQSFVSTEDKLDGINIKMSVSGQANDKKISYVLKDDTGTIDAPIGRHPTDRKKMSINYNHGKNAVTHYKVLKRFRQYTHVECRLETGRTHQIRVHMASIGHPLLGDVVYGPGKCPIAGREGQTLHAGILGFIHPRTGEYMEFTAPLPEYFEKLLNTLPE